MALPWLLILAFVGKSIRHKSASVPVLTTVTLEELYTMYRLPSQAQHLNVTTWRDDVAVVKLTSFLTYSNVIQQAIIAAPESVIPAGINLNQIGWEYRNDTALSEVSVVTIQLSNCSISFNDTQSLCSASSPLLDNANPGSPLLYLGIYVGLISGVNFVNNSTNTLVSASIASYTNWIISIIV